MNNQEFIRHALTDNVLLIKLGQSLDNNNAHAVLETITVAHDEGYTFIIVDMAEVDFLSSAGVGSILGTVEMFREQGGDIILCNVSNTALHVLKVLDLDDFLTIKPTVNEARELCGIKV